MKPSEKQISIPFLKNKQAIKDASIQSLRDSFEIEGIFFTDEEIGSMVNTVRQGAKQLKR